MKLNNDNAIKFYVNLKKRGSTLTRFLLCTTMESDSMNENPLAASNNKDFVDKSHSWGITNLGSASEDGSNNYLDKENILYMLINLQIIFWKMRRRK